MRKTWGRCAALVSAMALSACAGVPRLYKPAASEPSKTLAPKVRQIIDQITCELSEISRTQLKDKRYIITVNLTLQVDDEINLTPSLTFIEPLTVASTNRAVTQGLGVGGSRQRKFAAAFNYDTELLQGIGIGENKGKTGETFPLFCGAERDKFYRLDGHLGLSEIARDGVAIDTDRIGKTGMPSFASQVRFIITRSVGALGPTWTLVSFKGPGGANGLLNGKAFNTDSVDIAFSPYKPATRDPMMERLITEIELLVRTLARDERGAADDVLSARKVRDDTERRLSRNGLKSLSAVDMAVLRSADRAVNAALTRQQELSEQRANAEQDLIDANKEADTAAKTRSQEEAIREGEALITRMILQNLNVPPR